MLGQFSLTAMAVNYTRAQTQRGPLTSQKICHITKKKRTIPFEMTNVSFLENFMIYNQDIRCRFHIYL